MPTGVILVLVVCYSSEVCLKSLFSTGCSPSLFTFSIILHGLACWSCCPFLISVWSVPMTCLVLTLWNSTNALHCITRQTCNLPSLSFDNKNNHHREPRVIWVWHMDQCPPQCCGCVSQYRDGASLPRAKNHLTLGCLTVVWQACMHVGCSSQFTTRGTVLVLTFP